MLKYLKDILFPMECLFCRQYGNWLCNNCFNNLKINPSQYCLECKRLNKFGEFCSDCQANYYLNGVWIASDYEEKNLTKIIKTYKYQFIKDLGNNLSQFLIKFLNSKIFISPTKNLNEYLKISAKNILVISVPLSKSRLRWRGFNQSEILAENIARHFNLPLTKNLKRIKNKTPQAKLNEMERKNNLNSVFTWNGEIINNSKILLVDDITTTGATLNECAKILKENGAKEVWGLVLAKG